MTVKFQIADDVAEVVLDRPAKFNAVNEEMANQLSAAIDRVAQSGCRAMLLRGEGRGFCAGRDLADANPTHEDAEAILIAQFNPLFEALRAIPVPTIAVVQGPALGVGLGLAFACDVIFVGESAKVGSPFAGIGCVLDSGVPDERWGEAVHAVVVTRSPVDAAELIEHCRSTIAGYKVPKSFDIQEEPLPKSSAGKILKRTLRQPYWVGHDTAIS